MSLRFFIFFHKNAFLSFLFCHFLFLGQLKYTLFEDYFLWNCNDYNTLNCWLLLTFVSVFTLFGVSLHWLNYNIKVSVERWPHCHVRCLWIVFQLVWIILQTTSFIRFNAFKNLFYKTRFQLFYSCDERFYIYRCRVETCNVRCFFRISIMRASLFLPLNRTAVPSSEWKRHVQYFFRQYPICCNHPRRMI